MTRFDEVPDGEPFPVSATLYTTYLKCPQRALARLQGVYQPSSKASFKGLLAHRIFARHLEEGQIDDDAFPQVCRQEVGTHLGEMMASLAMKPSEFALIVRDVSDLYSKFAQIPTDGFTRSEASFEVEPVDGVKLRGRVDAIFDDNGSMRIVDWKTGSDLTGAVPQLDFYAMAWAKAFGSPPDTLEALSIRTGEKVVVVPTHNDIDLVESAVADMINILRSAIREHRELPRTAGPDCRWCPLLDDCDEGSSAMELLR